MRYIAAEDVAKAKEMDLLTCLRNYEPQELVHVRKCQVFNAKKVEIFL